MAIELVIGTIITCTFASIFYYQGMRVNKARRLMLQIYEVRSQIQRVYVKDNEIEQAFRNYTLSGNPGFIVHYEENTPAQMDLKSGGWRIITEGHPFEEVQRLRALVLKDSVQLKRVDELDRIFRVKSQYMDSVVRMQAKKPSPANATDERLLAGQTKTIISSMLASEHEKFVEQEGIESRFWQGNRILLRGGVLFLYFGLIFVVRVLYRKNKQRYELESSLRENDILTRAMMDGGNHGIVVSNKDRIVTAFNKAAERIYQRDASYFVGKHSPSFMQEVLLRSELEAEAERLGREAGLSLGIQDVFVFAIQKYGTYEKEWTIIQKDGTHFPISLSCTTLRDGEGEVYGFIGILQDISERKKLESKLFNNDILTRSMMDSGSHGVVITNKERIVIGFNKPAEILSGFDKDYFLGKRAPDFVDEAFLYSELEAEAVRIGKKENMSLAPKDVFFFAIKKYGTYQKECTLVQKNGTHVPIFLTCMSVLNEKGEVDGSISILQDISERKKLESMQKEFISIVSHELRTPLTSIRGALGLMETPGLDSQKMSELISMAHRNSERLVKIINDILDVEKIEFGNLSLNPQLLDVDSFIRNALDANQVYGEKYAVLFVQKKSSHNGLQVVADPDRLMQVTTNLLSNAAKFSQPDSEVIVQVKSLNNRVHFSIQDFGPGIPENFRDRIFDKFAQAESTENRSHAGSGLGLNISKRLLEAMGGNIRFETMMWKGTTFFFDLPQG